MRVMCEYMQAGQKSYAHVRPLEDPGPSQWASGTLALVSGGSCLSVCPCFR